MRSVIIVLLLVAVAFEMASASGPQYDIANAKALFEQFIKDYDRQYKDAADKDVHYHAFVESLEKINKLNKQESGATYDINKFADYTEEERKGMFGLRKPQ